LLCFVRQRKLSVSLCVFVRHSSRYKSAFIEEFEPWLTQKHTDLAFVLKFHSPPFHTIYWRTWQPIFIQVSLLWNFIWYSNVNNRIALAVLSGAATTTSPNSSALQILVILFHQTIPSSLVTRLGSFFFPCVGGF
jgi:hypothetical protein